MQQVLRSLNESLAPAEEIFFTWLLRVVIAASLAACAWLDDAPPLDIAAMAIAFYTAGRVATQFTAIADAAPFENRFVSGFCAAGGIVVLGLAFLATFSFVERLAISVAG